MRVTFDSDGGSVVAEQTVIRGGNAAEPETPTRDGYVFYGWHLLDAGGGMAPEAFDFSTPITTDITLRASWKHEHDGIIFQPWNRSDALPTEAGSWYLTRDVILTNVWDWTGGTLNLCLNGHAVTGSDIMDDHVIGVGGTLNLFDETGGRVTQAECYGNLVDVYGGAFTLRGGTISGGTNGGVYVEENGSFTMTGGRVTGNKLGVTVDGATFTVSGRAAVHGNRHSNTDLMTAGDMIIIGGALDAGSRIGVSADDGVFTSGLSGNGDASNFFSDDEAFLVGLNADGEAILGAPVTVTFAPGDESATGEMEAVTAASGSVYELPDCDFALTDNDFMGWRAGGEMKQPGDAITVTADVTVTAVWQYQIFGTPDFVIPAGTITIEESAVEGIAATVAEIPANCTSIGDHAFKDCVFLTQIRIPSDCELGTDVFDGCTKVYVFGTAGSPAEAYCEAPGHSNCVFIEESQGGTGE